MTAAATPNFSCLYFGYDSNISPLTLTQRCPGALHVGLAILPSYKFIINAVGFGTIVPFPSDHVYGNLYFLTAQHEAALDASEEVPDWHQKISLEVEMVGGSDMAGRKVQATCYVDTIRKEEGVISKEYVIWLRKAIVDGTASGVPVEYFEKYFRKWLPEDESVGREEEILMVRTAKVDREDLRFVPREMLGSGK